MKFNRKTYLTFCLFIFSTFFLLLKPAGAQDDWNYWSAYSFKYKITEKTSFVLGPQVRLRDDATDFFYWESYQGFAHNLNKHLELGLFHLYADSKNSAGKWTDENRLRVQATVKTSLGDFQLSDRNRYEYRVVGGKPKSRYRNEIKIAKPIKLWDHDITPYIANEFFYDFRVNEYVQNRTFFGVSKKLGKNVSGSLFYLIKSDRTGSDWKGTNIIGTALSFSL